ncbi:MAG: helix-turn-helix domain-containing protein [Acidobacteria bacterium]|nr:helix-turn-helix domain-containing protein [Acidobacteriota bacterium]
MPHEPVTLPESEEGQIRELNRMLQLGTPALVGADGERVELPDSVFRLLKDIARNMQLGRAVVLIPENQQLTTQRSADLLGVSRPHLIKLLEAGELPYHKAGSHRRIYLKDLLAYQKRRNAERKAALDRIAKEAFESGLYDRTGTPEDGEDE